MKIMFYTIAFLISAFAASAEQPHVTVLGDCMEIKVPTAIYHDAVAAGLRDFLAAQCVQS